MQLAGQAVKHAVFGKGIILDVTDQIITVDFAAGKKKFVYPDAFSGFLTLRDTETQNAITRKMNIREQKKELVRRKACARQEHLKELRTMRISPKSQAAFDIRPDEVQRVFDENGLSAGTYLSGYSKGEPRIPNRMKPNTACMLTCVPEGGKEADRRIAAVLMADGDFWGENAHDGWISLHKEMRILLPEDQVLLCRDYFGGGENPARWGSVSFKYFPNEVMQHILNDIRGMLTGELRDRAEELYRYFCTVNRLTFTPGE